VGRSMANWLNVSLSGTGAWYNDPASATDMDMGYQTRLMRQNLTPGMPLFQNQGPTLANLDSTALEREIQASLQDSLWIPQSRNQSWVQYGLGLGIALGPWHGLSGGLSASWSQTLYSHTQSSYYVNPAYWYYDTIGWAGTIVFRDTISGQDYVVKSISPHDAPSPSLVPATWSAHRRDQCWSTQTSLSWKAAKWLSLRAAWTWTRNVSNLEDYVDGASYVRNVVSLSSSVSW